MIMKGALIMKHFYTLKLVGLVVCLLTVTGMGVWLILPVHAESPPVATTQPAIVAKSANVEFHIIADSATADPEELKAAQARLLVGGRGPSPLPGDSIRWVEVEYPEQFDRPGDPPETREWNGSHFMPVLVTPDASMDQYSASGWNFVRARPFTQDRQSITFSFDARGAKLFGDLTTHWYKLVGQRKDLSYPRACGDHLWRKSYQCSQHQLANHRWIGSHRRWGSRRIQPAGNDSPDQRDERQRCAAHN